MHCLYCLKARLFATIICGILLSACTEPTQPRNPALKQLHGLPVFTELIKKVKPAVVNISTTKDIPLSTSKFIESGKRSVPLTSLGSGFIISADGHILTNRHIVDDKNSITVILDNKQEHKAVIVQIGDDQDIALLKIESTEPLPVLNLGDSSELETGEWVFAIGNPFGLGQTVTAGIISAVDRVIGNSQFDKMIQTDASINPGNSGGPLLDLQGQVIGINTAVVREQRGNMGIGFAIPVDQVKQAIEGYGLLATESDH